MNVHMMLGTVTVFDKSPFEKELLTLLNVCSHRIMSSCIFCHFPCCFRGAGVPDPGQYWCLVVVF